MNEEQKGCRKVNSSLSVSKKFTSHGNAVFECLMLPLIFFYGKITLFEYCIVNIGALDTVI
jgi:hypothetical protein